MKTLREIRTAKGYSLTRLSRISNCTKAQISHFENSKVIPSATTRVWLETILGEQIYFPLLPEMNETITKPRSTSNIKACALRFRYLLRMIKSLPEDHRSEFSSIMIKYLNQLL